MDREQAEAIADLLPAVAPVGRVLMQQRLRKRQINREKEAELELIEARANAEQRQQRGGGVTTTTSRDPEPAPPDPLDEQIDEMKRDADCDTCRLMLDAIADLPDDRKATAIKEYGEFKHVMDSGASTAELQDALRETDALFDAFTEEFDTDL